MHIETLDNHLKKMVHQKTPLTKKDLLTAIQESRNHFDKEYCFRLVKSISERIKAVIKVWGGATKY